MRRPAAVQHRRQEAGEVGEAERVQDVGLVGAGAVVAEGEGALGDVGGAHAGQVEVEPVLAVERGRGALDALGLVAAQPEELARLVAGVEPAAGVPEDPLAGAARVHLGDDGGGAGVEPQQAAADGRPVLVDQPSAVALAGDGQRQDLRPVEAPDQLAQDLHRVGPGARQVLLDAAAGQGRVAVGPRGEGELAALGVEGDRLDHRGAGVDADEDLAGHVPVRPRLSPRGSTAGSRVAGRPCRSPATLDAAVEPRHDKRGRGDRSVPITPPPTRGRRG